MTRLRFLALIVMFLAALPLGALRAAAGGVQAHGPQVTVSVADTAAPRVGAPRSSCRTATLPGQPCAADRCVLSSDMALLPPGGQARRIIQAFMPSAGRVVPIEVPPPRPL